MYDDFFAKALELQRRGKPFATATVVRVEKPTSGKPGDKAIVTLDGELLGWVGGSCARPTVVREALAALEDDRCRLIRLSSEPEEQDRRSGLIDHSMTCFSGGTMEIYIEPHQPPAQLMIVGDLPVAQALAQLGKVMSFHVIAVTLSGEPGVHGADEVMEGLEAMDNRIRPLTSVVVASHGDHDEVAVERALKSRATYVGLVASPRRSGSIREYLAQQGLGEGELGRLHAPAGLDIKARRADEIALSILAEIVQVRRNLDRIDWQAQLEASRSERPGTVGETQVAETAVDPICGMTVQVAGARHLCEHDGATYYFCCSGCLAKFSADPEAFLQP